MAGEYKGLLMGFDGVFLKVEYDIKTFTDGANVITKDIIFINAAYVVTINEYREKEDR